MSDPILVTGAPRSGTTWVGRMISQSPEVAYLHEPFNTNLSRNANRKGDPSLDLNGMYTYISEANEPAYISPMQSLLHSSPDKRTLMKDPIAVFSAEWLAFRFEMDVIVMLRHPAAFVGSLKKQQWKPKYTHFLRQPLLIEAHLEPFLSEIEKCTSWKSDIIDRASLLWKLIYHVVGKYMTRQPNWRFVRHEDLSRQPLEGFNDLFTALGLKYTEAIKKHIEDHCYATMTEDPDPNGLYRNSLENIKTWKTRLTAAETKRVRTQVEEVSSQYYSDQDWE